MPSRDALAEFTAWCRQHLRGDEKGEAQIFLDHRFQALGWAGGLKTAGANSIEDAHADGPCRPRALTRRHLHCPPSVET